MKRIDERLNSTEELSVEETGILLDALSAAWMRCIHQGPLQGMTNAIKARTTAPAGPA